MVSSRAILVTRATSATSSFNTNNNIFALRARMLTRCCCKCSLRTGTFCCGLFSLILSTTGIIANGAFSLEYPEFYALERSLVFEGILTFIVSAFCVHGALKECKYSLMPWLLTTAFTITVLALTAIYFVVFGCFDLIIVGLALLMFVVLLVYAWMCVASYYSELRDRELTAEETANPARSYISPSAVTNPAAFAAAPPPPAYSVAMGNPAFEEKPPTYEEAETEKRRAERGQQTE